MANNPLNISKVLWSEQENQNAIDTIQKQLKTYESTALQVSQAVTASLKKTTAALKLQSKAALAAAEGLKSFASQPDLFKKKEQEVRELALVLQALTKIQKEKDVQLETSKKVQKEVIKIQKDFNKQLALQEKANKKLEANVKRLTEGYKKMPKVIKAADNSLEKLKLEAKEAEKTFKGLEDSIDSTGKEVLDAKENFLRLKSQLNESNQEIRDQVKAIDLAEDSYLSWQAVVTKASKELKKLEDPLGKNKVKADALRKSINKNKDKLKEFDKSIGNFQRNVGNYESALGKLEGAFNDLPGAVSGSVGALIEFGKNLKGNKIAAAATAVVGLGAALSQTKEGGEEVEKVTAGLEAVYDTSIGFVAVLTKGVVDFLTAKDELGRTEALDGLNGALNSVAGVMNNNVTVAKKAKGEFIALEKASRPLELTIARLNIQYELQNAIADDATKSFKDRKEASLKAFKLSELIALKQIDQAKEELSIIVKRLQIKTSSGVKDKNLLDQQLEATKKLIEAEGEYTLRIRENEKQRTELKQDRLEKDLDILIDGFDNQKTINERIIGSDKTVFDNRQKLLNETRILADASFKAQKSIIDELSTAGVNVDDLLKLDATELNKRIRSLEQSEIIEGRTLEVIRERRIVLQDLKEAQDDLNDAAFERLELETNIALKTALLDKLTLKERKELIEKFNKDAEEAAIVRLENEIAARKTRNEDTLALESQLQDALFAQKEGQLEKEQELADKAAVTKKESIDDEIKLINLNEQRATNLNSFLQKNIKDENTLKALKFAQFLIEQRAAKLRERAKNGGVGAAPASTNVFGILSRLPAFAKGVIDFKGAGTETSDSNVVRIANRESVMTGKATRNAKGLLNEIQSGRLTDMNIPTLEAKQPNMVQLERSLTVQPQKEMIDYDKLASKMGIEVAKNMPKVDIEKMVGYLAVSSKTANHIHKVAVSSRSLKRKT